MKIKFKCVCRKCGAHDKELSVDFNVSDGKPVFYTGDLTVKDLVTYCSVCGTEKSHLLIENQFFDLYSLLYEYGYELVNENRFITKDTLVINKDRRKPPVSFKDIAIAFRGIDPWRLIKIDDRELSYNESQYLTCIEDLFEKATKITIAIDNYGAISKYVDKDFEQGNTDGYQSLSQYIKDSLQDVILNLKRIKDQNVKSNII